MTRIGSRYYTDAEMQDINSYVQEKERLAKIEALEEVVRVAENNSSYRLIDKIEAMLSDLKAGQ